MNHDENGMDITPYLAHLDVWLTNQFEESLRLALRKVMVAKIEEDGEYWIRQDYWKLHDAATGKHPFA